MNGGRSGDQRGLEFERVVFFSDAVFAIAITLLAIDLRLPAGTYTDATLVDLLISMGPEIAAFVLSFGVIALFWIGHFRTFRLTQRLDMRLVGLNLLFLGFVALLPFPTSVLAAQGNLTAAALFYASYVLVMSLLSTGLFAYVHWAGLTHPVVTPAVARRVRIRALAVPIVFALSIPVAFVSPSLAELMWFGSIGLQAVLTRRLHLSDPVLPRDP